MLALQVIDEASIRSILSWRYEPPYDVYNLNEVRIDQALAFFLNPKHNYHSINRADRLVGYCCFGEDARVLGGRYWKKAFDIGVGIRPDMTGRGEGIRYVDMIVRFIRGQQEQIPLRVTIAEFNKRAQRVWQKAGFRYVDRFFDRRDDKPFVVMLRED